MYPTLHVPSPVPCRSLYTWDIQNAGFGAPGAPNVIGLWPPITCVPVLQASVTRFFGSKEALFTARLRDRKATYSCLSITPHPNVSSDVWIDADRASSAPKKLPNRDLRACPDHTATVACPDHMPELTSEQGNIPGTCQI